MTSDSTFKFVKELPDDKGAVVYLAILKSVMNSYLDKNLRLLG